MTQEGNLVRLQEELLEKWLSEVTMNEMHVVFQQEYAQNRIRCCGPSSIATSKEIAMSYRPVQTRMPSCQTLSSHFAAVLQDKMSASQWLCSRNTIFGFPVSSLNGTAQRSLSVETPF